MPTPPNRPPLRAVPRPKPTSLPLWERAVDAFHGFMDVRSRPAYADVLEEVADLPPTQVAFHSMHLLYRGVKGVADIAGTLRRIEALLARELPAHRRRLDEIAELVEENGERVADAVASDPDDDFTLTDDGEEPGDDDADGEDEGDEDPALEDDDEDGDPEALEREFAAQQKRPTIVHDEGAEAVKPDAIIVPQKKKPARPRRGQPDVPPDDGGGRAA